jgi:3-isopropylmalate/(R)-2-methylmalate dehydratase small subunit
MAEPFVRVTSVAAPLIEDNVDTDIIIPSREMKGTGKTGLAAGLFAGRRYVGGPGSRTPDPAFVLNQPRYQGARILLSGANFGCGSSREHAVWALAEHGFRAVIAASFSPIFEGNAVLGGIVPVRLPPLAIAELAAATGPMTVDLPQQSVTAGDAAFRFEIDGDAKAMLLDGLDPIDLTLRQADAIAAWQAEDRAARPWVYLGGAGEAER